MPAKESLWSPSWSVNWQAVKPTTTENPKINVYTGKYLLKVKKIITFAFLRKDMQSFFTSSTVGSKDCL